MATTLYAFTNIEYGTGKTKKSFRVGDEVKGLPTEVMKELVAAGALSKYNRVEVEENQVTDDDIEGADGGDDAPPPTE